MFTSKNAIDLVMCDFVDIEAWEQQSVGGCRTFRRKFDKKYYPLLGDDDEEKELIHLRGFASSDRTSEMNISKSKRSYKGLSTTASKMQDLCRDPNTGKWRWPINGADLVYPGIYLGDE